MWTRHYNVIIAYRDETNYYNIWCESLSLLLCCRGFVTPDLMLLQYYNNIIIIIIIITIIINTPANIFCALKRYCTVYYYYYYYYYIQRAFHADRRKVNCNIRVKTIIIGHTPRARQTRWDTYLFILAHIIMIIITILWFSSITTTMMIIIIMQHCRVYATAVCGEETPSVCGCVR